MTEPHIYREAGVDYLFEEEPGFQPFRYRCYHVPTQHSRQDVVWVRHPEDGQRLLAHWNRTPETWHYIEVTT